MRNLTTLVLMAGLAALVAGSASAAPSFAGYTGLLAVPNADVLTEKSFNVGYTDISLTGGDVTNTFGNYGIGSNVEIGFNRMRNDAGERRTLLNGKFMVMGETDRRAGLAVGMVDATGELDRTFYVVASKSIGRTITAFDREITNVRLHAGLGTGMLDGAMLGVSAVLGKRLAILAEYDSSQFNVGARLFLVEGLRLHGGLFDIGDSTDGGLGISFSRNY